MPSQRDPRIESSLCISLDALESLDAGLKQLRQFEGHFYLSSDKPDSGEIAAPFWFSTPNDYNTKDTIIDFDATIKQFHLTARRYRMALTALSSMKNSLKRHLAKISYSMKPVVLAHGIDTIPDEILARIFECIYEPWPSDDTYLRPLPEQLRLVCRRFQQIVDSQQSLRRRFTSEMPIGKLQERLDGCGQVGLRVKIPYQFAVNDNSTISASVRALVPQAHRWEELHFFHNFNLPGLERVLDRFKSLNLPRLERLVMGIREPRHLGTTEELCSTWTMPNLRRIVLCGGVLLNLPGKAGLLECDIVLEQRDWHIRGIYEICTFLSSLTSLTTLRLTYSRAIFERPYHIPSCIRLPNLRTLVADFYLREDRAEDSLLRLVEHIEAPQLEELFLKFQRELPDAGSLWSASNYLGDLLRTHGETGSLQTFSFTQESWMTYHEIGLVVKNPCNGNIFISGLELGCFDHPEFSSYQGGAYGLRTLTFKNCKLSKKGLELLLTVYTTKEWYPNFEGIIIEQCKGITWEDLGGLGVAHSERVFIRDDWL